MMVKKANPSRGKAGGGGGGEMWLQTGTVIQRLLGDKNQDFKCNLDFKLMNDMAN